MSYRTEEVAMQTPCPVAAIQGDAKDGKVKPNCRGRSCMLWRWRNDINDPFWQSAVKREHALIKGKNPSWNDTRAHKQAVANVNANPDGYMTDSDTRTGYCGLGGKV